MYSSVIVELLAVYIICATAESYTNDYCWREFEGTIPNDALTAGSDKSGNPVYIGQILFNGRLVPAKIHKNGKKVYFEWFDVDYASHLNMKILSTKQPQKFEWLPVKKGEAIGKGSSVLVKGGHEENYPTFIGRVANNGETSIGKTKCREHNKCEGLYAENKGSYQEYKAFEVLSFNPTIENNDSGCNPDIDVRMNN